MSDNFDLAAVEVEFARLFCRRLDDRRIGAGGLNLERLWLGFLNTEDSAVVGYLLLGDPRRFAIERPVSEQPCSRTGVVENVEPQFAVVIAHARAAPNDLLKFTHRADDPSKNNVLARWRVHARCQEL